MAIVTEFPREPGRPHGGVEAVSVNLVRGLNAFEDLEVHVVATNGYGSETRCDEFEGVRIHRLPRGRGKLLAHAIGDGRRIVCDLLSRLEPDIIHAHDYYGLMVKGRVEPRVFTIHGFIYADTLIAGGRFARLRAYLWRRVETGGWAEQPHIISISPYVRERLSGIARGVIHDIDNPIAESFFEIERCERKGTIFCAALICPRKNQVALIEAVGLLRKRGVDAELRLAGAFVDAKYADRVRCRIDALGLGERVRLLGSIDSEQVGKELSEASVFALTSLEEGSPMGIEEAMAAGVPIVTSNRCGMPYMVRDGESGCLIDPTDVDDIAHRIEEVLVDKELRVAMGSRAQEIALDRFHPAVVARRTRAVYERALRDARRRSNGQA